MKKFDLIQRSGKDRELEARLKLEPNADGTVRQLWETSSDDGKTWAASFDGLYRKATTPVP